MTFTLNQLRPNKGASRGKIRVGRGIGSGKGKTGGRGGKGQTARSGSAINGFEGGQTPIHRRLPKRGFNNYSRKEYEVVNVSDIQKAVDEKKLTGAITLESLKSAGLVKGRLDGVKLLGDGKISAKVEITVSKATASAIKAVEAAGGKVTLTAGKADTAEGKETKEKGAKAEKTKKTSAKASKKTSK